MRTLSAALLVCLPLAGCASEQGDEAASTDDVPVLFAEAPLPATMTSTPASLQATATAGHAFAPARLLEVATDYAARYQGLAADAAPLGVTYLKDADGEVTAMSVTYALGGPLSHPTASGLQTWITSQSNAIRTAIAADDALPVGLVAGLRLPGEYLNVIVGATPRQPRLLSMTQGLPVQVFEQLGRRRIADELEVALADVSAGTAFYEPTLDPSGRMGLRYQVNGKGQFLFFVPHGGRPLGFVVPASTFGPARTTAIANYKTALAASMSQAAGTPLTPLLETKHARQWGRTFALMDAQSGAGRPLACSNCSSFANTAYQAGVADFHGEVFQNDDGCDCTETDHDGTTRTVADCDDLSERCCELVDGEYPDGTNVAHCLNECTCECEDQEWDTIYYDLLLRGVPNLFQQSVDIPWTPFCHDFVHVGCGPVAAAELAVWYDNLGYDELLDHHHDTSGKFLWQDLTAELREDYIDVTCWGDATYATNENLADGTSDYFLDQGVDVAVQHDTVHVSEEASAWATIVDEIAANRPLILGFDPDDLTLGDHKMDHFALITGHSTTMGTDEIHLNMGWGLGSTEIREWDLVGTVHLITVDVASTATGNEECMADTSLSTLFAESPSNLDWSASWWGYDDYPLLEHLTGGGEPDCDRIGGATSGWFDAHWTEVTQCITPHDLDVVDESYASFEEELNDNDIPDWIWE